MEQNNQNESKPNDDCVLCEEEIDTLPHGWSGGHYAQPVADGRCCTECNNNVVLPARFKAMEEMMLTIKRNSNGRSD